MSSGIAAKLPLTLSNTFGPYELITDFSSLAKQNLKMLVLTSPGERMMDANFGVGLKKYLFEQNDSSIYSEIDENIRKQVARYLPYIRLDRIMFEEPPDYVRDAFPHTLNVAIWFTIISLQINTVLNIEVDINSN
jgi:hypothetical protein